MKQNQNYQNSIKQQQTFSTACVKDTTHRNLQISLGSDKVDAGDEINVEMTSSPSSLQSEVDETRVEVIASEEDEVIEQTDDDEDTFCEESVNDLADKHVDK